MLLLLLAGGRTGVENDARVEGAVAVAGIFRTTEEAAKLLFKIGGINAEGNPEETTFPDGG